MGDVAARLCYKFVFGSWPGSCGIGRLRQHAISDFARFLIRSSNLSLKQAKYYSNIH
jgi:hypothetical protein